MVRFLKQRLFTGLTRNGNRKVRYVVYNTSGTMLGVCDEEDHRKKYPDNESAFLHGIKVGSLNIKALENINCPDTDTVRLENNKTLLLRDLLEFLSERDGVNTAHVEVLFTEGAEVLKVMDFQAACNAIYNDLYWDEEANWADADRLVFRTM